MPYPLPTAFQLRLSSMALLGCLWLLSGSICHAEIFRCTDLLGKTTFSDTRCDADNNEVEVITPPESNTIVLTDDEHKNLKSIYTGKLHGTHTRFLKVSIYEETDHHIIFHVRAFYNGPSSAKAEFRVMPNMSWSARSFSTSDYGITSGYARVGLGSKAEDFVESDIITLQVWQYTPNQSPKVLETKIIPFKKKWYRKPSNAE